MPATTTGMPLLDVRGLTVTYNPGDWNERRVLEDVQLRVSGGDFVVLSGPNGSGKSSFLRALSGDLARAKVQGSADLCGRPLLGMGLLHRARVVSVVDQDPIQGTCEHLSVREQLLLAGREVQHRVAERLSGFASTVDIRQRVQSLSGGQRQLLAVLIAVERRTPVLLADEPTAALDPHFASLVLELLLERRGNPSFATLMVSHQGQLNGNAPGMRRVSLVDRRLVADVGE